MALKIKSKPEFGRLAFFVSVLLIGAIALATMPRLTIPLSIAYVLNLILAPLVPMISKFGVKRDMSIFMVLIGLIFFSTYPIVKVAPTVASEARNLQYYIPKIENYVRTEFHNISSKIKKKTGYEIEANIFTSSLDTVKDSTTKAILKIPTLIGSVVEWIFLVPLFVFFILKDGNQFRSIILQLAPNSLFERFYYLIHQFNKQLGDYIFAKFIEAFIVGTIITTGLLIMDIRFALLLGIIAALTNVIPYLGPFLGMIPAIVFGLAEYGVGSTFGGMMILYIVANAIDIGLVFPILVSKIVNLHPLVVVMSVVFGSQTMGILGMVISIPLAAALKLIILEVYSEIYGPKL